MKFTFYLFKEEIKTPEQAFRKGKLNLEDGYIQLAPSNRPLSYTCQAYVQYRSETTPSWVKSFGTHFEIEKDRAKNYSNSLVLLIPVEGRLFGVTYGYGFTAINRDLVEKDFGKKVAVNEVDPKNLRQMNSRDLDTSTRQTSVVTNRPSSIHDYKFKTNSDLITMVAGIPSSKEYARRISGATSLIATMDIDINDLGNKCKELLDSYHKKDYLKPFGFIDRFTPIEDPQLVNQLEDDLENSLINGSKDMIFFSKPSGNFNSDVIAYYELEYQSDTVEIDDVEGKDIFFTIKNLNYKPGTIGEVNITAFDENGETVLEKVSVLNYIVYETFTGSTNYIHMEGKWYQIDRDFYLEITERAKDIEEIEDQNFLPPKPKDTIERVYNKKTCEDKGYLLLDTKLYYFGGYDKVEVCDILTPAYEFICVKPYSSSSTLSHLFSQGMVSGQLLTNLPAYKSKVQEQIESSDLGFGSLLEKENRDITFVFAIATIKKGKLVETLPFFSKLTLLEAYQALQGLGYIVKVFKIPVEE